MSSPVIIDIFRTITDKASVNLGMSLNYMHGHPKEITDSLTEMTKNPTAAAGKYPLVALFQDFEEDKSGDFTKVKLQMIIAVLTNNKMKAPERYDASFRPYLYPIYEELIRVIARSGYFNESTIKQVKHIKVDRLFWGRNGLYGNQGNVFNDFVDCIEIKNLSLNVKPIKC